MEFGTGLPMIALDSPTALRDYAQVAEGVGDGYVSLAGHLLSTEPERYPDRPKALFVGPYHEPMVTFAYLAGATSTLQFMTSILILPLFPGGAGCQAGGRTELHQRRPLPAWGVD